MMAVGQVPQRDIGVETRTSEQPRMVTDCQTETSSDPQQRMACMEVWGGNSEADKEFSLAGVDVALRSRVFGQQGFGGDIYLVSSCASGRITRVLLADVSGHGALVARVAADLRDLLRRYVNVVSQNQLVSEVNRGFSLLAEEGGFATAVVCTYFAPTKSLAVSNAGHPPPLLKAAGSRDWRPLTGHDEDERNLTNTPLGIDSNAAYTSPKLRLGAGDMILCYSDAWSEAVATNGRPIGVEGLRGMLNKARDGTPHDILVDLEQRLRAQNDTNLSVDDTTAILMRVTNTTPTWRDNLLAPFRLFRKAHDNTRFQFTSSTG